MQIPSSFKSKMASFTRERAYFEFLESVERLAKRIRSNRCNDQVGSTESVEAEFERLARWNDYLIVHFFDHHRYQPDVLIVLSSLMGNSLSFQALEEGSDQARGLAEGCVVSCRRKFAHESVKKDKKRFDQRWKENASSCQTYVDSLLSKFPNLSVCKLELYAPAQHQFWQLDEVLAAETAIDHLLKKLSGGEMHDTVVGHILMRQPGLRRVFHYSLFLFQEGHSPQLGQVCAEAVGREWIEQFQRATLTEAPAGFEYFEGGNASLLNPFFNLDAAEPLSVNKFKSALRRTWEQLVVFDAKVIKADASRNPSLTLGVIAERNLRKSKVKRPR